MQNRLKLKKLHLCLIFCGASTSLFAAGKPDSYVLHIWKVKSGVSYEQAKAAAEELNPIYKKTKGFEKRHLYFDKEKSVWIEQLKWKHSDAAAEAEKSLSQNQAIKKFEEMIDKTSLQTFRSERLFEVGS